MTPTAGTRSSRSPTRGSVSPSAAIDDTHVAPLLCAGMIGYRALAIAGDGERLGLYGFGSSAHILCQITAAEGRRVSLSPDPVTRPVGHLPVARGRVGRGSDETPPEPFDAAIVFAPVGSLMVDALRASASAGRGSSCRHPI